MTRRFVVRRSLPKALLFFCLACPMLASSEVSVPDNPEHAWLAPQASHSLLLALDVADNDVFVAGERGHVLKASVSNLSNWQQASVEAQILLNAVYMHNARQGWVVGHDAVILSTVDGGSSWQRRFQAADLQQPLFDIWFSDIKHGIAIGAYGYYLTTSDAGKTWQASPVNEEHDFHLNSITDNGEGTLFIAAESGYVYRSADQGESWHALKPPYEGSFFDIVAYGNTVVVVGLRGHAFISRDKGDNWHPLATNTQTTLTAVTRLQNGQLLIVGHAGVILISNDEMSATSLYRQPGRSAFSDVVEIKANQLVLAGEHGVSTLDLCRVLKDKLSGGCE